MVRRGRAIRRARRLLPALFVMLTVVTAWVTIADRARLAGLRGAVAAAATYSSNWYLIAANQSGKAGDNPGSGVLLPVPKHRAALKMTAR